MICFLLSKKLKIKIVQDTDQQNKHGYISLKKSV